LQARVKNITDILETHYPPYLAEKWDNVGLQIGSSQNPVEKIMIGLDLDNDLLTKAIKQKVDLIITHHPLFFNPIKSINYDSPQGSLIAKIIKNDMSVYAAHTNLDSASEGLNQFLAEKLGLMDIQLLNNNYREALYKLVVYVPSQDEAVVREAMSFAGAGHLGEYSHCSFRSMGIGTFLPMEGTNPYIGKPGVLEETEEIRLETIVPHHKLAVVIAQMLAAHPYEEAAYDIFPLLNQGQAYSPGRIGNLPVAMSLQDFCGQVKNKLGLDSLRVVGNCFAQVQKIAVVSGAGTSFMAEARATNCDLLLTGDLKYHEAKDAEAMGLAIVDAGHQGTEQLMVNLLADLLAVNCQQAGFELEIIPVIGNVCIKSL